MRSSLLPEAAKNFILKSRNDSKTELWKERALALPLARHCPPPIGTLSEVLRAAKGKMDAHICGNVAAKEEVTRVLGQWITAGKTSTNAIGLEGPAGVGKTTFARCALAEALGRPFCSISLGGASDGSMLTGHSFTYEGSMPGRVAQELTRAGCMDPVLYFDELDKVSNSARGDEVINALIHLTDGSQNTEFHDRYFHGVPLDLSRAILVFSFNDRRKISSILLDRLKIITCASPTDEEKRCIARKHLIPRAVENVGGGGDLVTFDDAALEAMMHCTEERGVRELDRSIQHVVNTVNVAANGAADLVGLEALSKPVRCTAELCAKILPKSEREASPPCSMYT